MKEKVIFGAGRRGRAALAKYRELGIAFFVDNDVDKQGKEIDGYMIRSPECLKKHLDQYSVIIASRQIKSIRSQLLEMGLTDIDIYAPEAYYEIPELVYNPYQANGEFRITGNEKKIIDINCEIRELKQDQKLFEHIEIETINRCNGICDFCPVNRRVDPRDFKKMDEELFFSIINQLERLEYTGRIALFSNNEPFLDDRIIGFHKYMREHLPKARAHLFTNGTLLELDKFIEIVPYLDELIIDNYNQELKLIPQSQKIVDYCEGKPDLKKKVTIILRKPKDVLTSRGGDAPNTKHTEKYPDAGCIFPFKQMIVRPDGKVSLCCNDALGKCTMGDLKKETLEEVWYGHKFEEVRNLLSRGRKNFERCRYCDSLYFL